jgi:hypothetical protein
MAVTAPLALFHTGEAHVTTFASIIGRLAPEIPLVHRVRKDLLDAAQPAGLTPTIRRNAVQEMLALADAGAGAVLCTCSTLGPAAETAADLAEVPVLRVDRPLMEAALACGPRLAVAACLPSTIGPTRTLLERVAAERGVRPAVNEILLAEAWPLFEHGDRAGYAQAIARGLTEAAPDVDAVVLAQASMAPAAELCRGLAMPVLASPKLGAAAAVAAWRARHRASPARF